MHDATYSILGEFIICRHRRSCLQSLSIVYGGNTYYLGQNRKLKVDNISKPLPYNDLEKIYIYMSSPHHMEAMLRNGITVLWDGKKTAEITVPGSFFGNTLGKLKICKLVVLYIINSPKYYTFCGQNTVQCCKDIT